MSVCDGETGSLRRSARAHKGKTALELLGITSKLDKNISNSVTQTTGASRRPYGTSHQLNDSVLCKQKTRKQGDGSGSNKDELASPTSATCSQNDSNASVTEMLEDHEKSQKLGDISAVQNLQNSTSETDSFQSLLRDQLSSNAKLVVTKFESVLDDQIKGSVQSVDHDGVCLETNLDHKCTDVLEEFGQNCDYKQFDERDEINNEPVPPLSMWTSMLAETFKEVAQKASRKIITVSRLPSTCNQTAEKTSARTILAGEVCKVESESNELVCDAERNDQQFPVKTKKKSPGEDDKLEPQADLDGHKKPESQKKVSRRERSGPRGRRQVNESSEPCTSDDLNELPRNAKGRALPVPQLVMGKNLQEIIQNLEPQDSLDEHVSLTKFGKRYTMKCRYCDQTIQNLHDFRRHIKTHPEANYTPFHCPFCDYKGQIRAQISRHINIHSNTKPYVCKLCGRGFNFKQKLQVHMKYHADVRDQKCPMCELSFHEFKTLKNHLRNIHELENVDEVIPRKRRINRRVVPVKDQGTSYYEVIGDFSDLSSVKDSVQQAQESIVVVNTQGDNILSGSAQVFLIDASRHEADAVISVDALTLTSGNHHQPTSDVKLVELLQTSDSQLIKGTEIMEVADAMPSATVVGSLVSLQDCSFYGENQLVAIEFDKTSVQSGNLEKETVGETVEINSTNKKPRVQRKKRHGIIGNRKTLLQTRRFEMSLNGEGSSANESQYSTTEPSHKSRGRLLGSSKRFVNNQRFVLANEISNNIKKYCNVFNNHPDFPEFKVVFVCKLCAMPHGSTKHMFPSQKQFASHLENVHSEIKAWQCQFCSYRCRLRTSLIVHSKMHLTRGNHICELCGESFVFKQKLLSHIRQHLNRREFVCDVCPKAFNEPSHLRKHVKTVHCNDRPCVCGVCGKSFKDSMNLKRHLEVHEKTRKKYLCDCCNKLYKTQTSLLQHSKSHECIFHCEICNRNFGSYSGFTAHKIMHDESLTGYTCSFCYKVLHTKGSLLRHLTMVHSDSRAFKCGLCAKSFKSKKDVQMHKFVHMSEKIFVCNVCGFECKRATSLSVHARRHYTIKPFRCSICNKEYTQKQSLETHLGKHNFLGNIDCQLCGKTCAGSLALREHLQSDHSGRRYRPELKLDRDIVKTEILDVGIAFPCEDCNSVFSTQDNLAGHILAEHMKPQAWSGHLENQGVEDAGLYDAPEAIVQCEVSTEYSPDVNLRQMDVTRNEECHEIQSVVMVEDPLTSKERFIQVLIPKNIVGQNCYS